VLALPAKGPPTSVRAMAFTGLGVLTWAQGDEGAARTLCEEGLAAARALGDPRQVGSALAWLAHVVPVDDPETVRRLNEEALAIGRRLGDLSLTARTLNNIAEVLRRGGDYERAATLYEESLELARRSGNVLRVAMILHNLGHVSLHAGDPAGAAARF